MCGHRGRTGERRATRGASGTDVAGRGSDPAVRVSDSERDDVATLLRDHAGEGRLSSDELEDRVGRALSATTRAELDGLLADLPYRHTARNRAARRSEAVRDFTAHVITYLAVCTMLVGIWLADGAGPFWPAWVIGFWGLGVVSHFRAGVLGQDRRRRHRGQAGGWA
jgi:hypothetical protein